MNSFCAVATVIVCALPPAAGVAQECASECWFPTGEPAIVDIPGRRGWPLLSQAEYDGVVADFAQFKRFVPVRELPDERRPLLGFGKDVRFGRSMRGMAFYGSLPEAVVYVDVDGDGSLRDEAARPLLPEDGRFAALIETDLTEEADDGVVTFPLRAKLLLIPPRREGGAPTWLAGTMTTRDGVILVDRQRVPFRLWGRGGRYDSPITDLWFDLDGDGQGFESEWSEERFHPADETVNLGEKSYAFHVDRYGRGLTLRPLSERLPDRPRLAVGAPAPEIRAVDVTGRPVDLEALRGKVVLIAFAGSGCGTCREQAPALVELEQRFRGKGVAVLGVSWEPAENVQDFAREFGEEWPQVSEPEDRGPIHLAYRAISYPRFVLIGRDGRLVALDPQFEELEALLRGLVASPD